MAAVHGTTDGIIATDIRHGDPPQDPPFMEKFPR